jgi:hypothetical protein
VTFLRRHWFKLVMLLPLYVTTYILVSSALDLRSKGDLGEGLFFASLIFATVCAVGVTMLAIHKIKLDQQNTISSK